MTENKLVSPFKKEILLKEKNLVSDYVDMYLNKPDANQMLVYGELAKKYNYSNAESVRAKFTHLKKKYGRNYIKIVTSMGL
ncbi:hypothetical protein [Empedobacter sp.]|uniref:hypothetical protein n=1 Tax=Empedobacter sp. TaxID=1927715 RepID=UPI0028983A97|nr:hypothetical protein [Empedobacter sp.]